MKLTRFDVMKKPILILFFCVFTTLVISNISAFSMIGGKERTVFGDSELDGYGAQISEEMPLVLDNIDTPICSVEITLDSNKVFYTDVTVAFTDNNFSLDSGFDYNYCRQLMKSGENSVNYMNISSYGNVGSLEISCDDRITVKQVRINTGKPISFSAPVFLVVFVLAYLTVFKLWNANAGDKLDLIVRVCAGIICVLVVWFMAVVSISCDEPLIEKIPNNVSGEDQYVQLFDAFHDHRTYLDIDFDSEKMAELSNPYDRTLRNEAGLHGDFWDRAYYKGKLYCYFGSAPVLTVYYPVYIVTHKIPTTLFVSGILALYCVVFISLLYGLLVKKLVGDVPIVMLVFGQAAIIFGSGIFAAAAETMFYFMAVLSGVAWTAAFWFFLLKAYYSDELRSRIVFLVCCGVSGALTAASRPTLLLYCAVGIVPAVFVMTSKRETLKNKISCVLAVGTPLLIGAALIMMYNYKRFDNPFEFGFNYQLTVSRAQANTIKLSLLPAALYHYFFQQPSVKSSFPYIRLTSGGLDSYTRYSYAGRTMGVFTYPVSWGVSLLPVCIKKGESFRSLLLLSMTGSAVLMSFIDMCKAGSHYRYTVDIGFVILLTAVICMFMLINKLEKISVKAYIFSFVLFAALTFANIVLGVLMIFANESERMISEYPEAVELFRGVM